MSRSFRCLSATLTLCCLLAAACGSRGAGSPQAVDSGLTSITLGRQQVNAGLSDDGRQLAVDHRAGALALYQAISAAPGAVFGNLVFSPMALQLALGMLYLGADSETASELAAAMRWRQAPGAFAAAQANLLDAIASAALPAAGADSERAAVLQTTTRVFLGETFPLLPSYAAALKDTYQAPAALLDFAHAPEESRQRINAWGAEQTANKILDILPPGSITSNTLVALAAALRFKAFWFDDLARSSDNALDFTTASSATVAVPALGTTGTFSYRAAAHETVAALPYFGGGFRMLLVRPTGDLAAYERGLDANALESILSGDGAAQTLLEVTMPPFDVSYELQDLPPVLQTMGVHKIFTAPNELNLLDPTASPPAVVIGGVFEKAHIAVDEHGTEAEAVAVVVGGTGAVFSSDPPVPLPFKLDRPFLFFVQETVAGSVVFMGRVTDPS